VARGAAADGAGGRGTGSAGATAAQPASARRRGFVGPLLLLSAGLVLLLNNLGLLPWSIWRDVWPFWPLLLILLGLESFVTGRVAWGGLVLTILLVVGIGSGIAFTTWGDRWHRAATPTGPPSATLRQAAEGATRASVRLDYGGGTLAVSALDEPGLLATGDLYREGGGRLDAAYSVSNNVGSLRIAPSDGKSGNGGRSWGGGKPWGGGTSGEHGPFGLLNLRLVRDLPLDLRLSVGAADATLDLSGLRIASLRLETGASQVRLILPATGQPDIRIEGGAANVEVRVPDGMEARIVSNDGPSLVDVDEQRFRRVGDEYRSAGYDGAANRATITISMGAARIAVQ